MRDDGGAAGSIVVAFVLGAITGAAAALLLTPATGADTRRRLGERARSGRDQAGDAVRQGREYLNRQRDVVAAAFERGRQAYDQARGASEPPAAPEGSAQ